MDINDFISENGRVSSTKTTEKYVKRHFGDDYELIISHSGLINLNDCTFSEKIYHYINNLNNSATCRNCGKNKPKFTGLLNGYLEYCSSKCSNGSDSVKSEKIKSYLKEYGVDNPSKSKEVIEKIQKSFDDRFGGNPFSLDEFKEKIKKTNKLKYGAEYSLSRGSSLRDSINKKTIIELTKKYEYLDVININPNKWGDVTIRCKICNNNFEISKWNLHQRTKRSITLSPCTVCNPIGESATSLIEETIKIMLDNRQVEYERKNRKILEGKEIDFYLDRHKMGIEVNGIYWHSDRFKDKSYHINKTKMATENGIRIIHVFEDEISEKPDLVESRIMSILGIHTERIFARKCGIQEIDSRTCNEFLLENHMQGSCGATFRYGLFYKNVLVSIMTFGELRKNMGNRSEENTWELIRFCNIKGANVIGGASKLLSHFIKTKSPKKIVSYCDRRWSDGEFYKKIGFELSGLTAPNYWYVKNGIRENRFKYRKDRLVNDGFDKDKTESTIMYERGFLRIYDCGSYRFIMDLY